jgi:hypothetical protein
MKLEEFVKIPNRIVGLCCLCCVGIAQTIIYCHVLSFLLLSKASTAKTPIMII